MSKAAIGDVVKIYMDSWEPIKEGDYVVTASTGRTYFVMDVRVQQKGIRKGRQHLVVRVAPPEEPSPQNGDKIHTLHWYARGKAVR